MSKTLVLVRHAKSSWTQANTADIDRPLKKRGYRDSALIGDWLKDYCRQHDIDEITALVSPSNRTRITSKAMIKQLDGIRCHEVVVDGIYLATSEELFDIIHAQDNATDTLMLIGHNPGMHDLLQKLVPELVEKFPTCAIACIELDTDDWKDVSRERYLAHTYTRPKLLRKRGKKD